MYPIVSLLNSTLYEFFLNPHLPAVLYYSKKMEYEGFSAFIGEPISLITRHSPKKKVAVMLSEINKKVPAIRQFIKDNHNMVWSRDITKAFFPSHSMDSVLWNATLIFVLFKNDVYQLKQHIPFLMEAVRQKRMSANEATIEFAKRHEVYQKIDRHASVANSYAVKLLPYEDELMELLRFRKPNLKHHLLDLFHKHGILEIKKSNYIQEDKNSAVVLSAASFVGWCLGAPLPMGQNTKFFEEVKQFAHWGISPQMMYKMLAREQVKHMPYIIASSHDVYNLKPAFLTIREQYLKTGQLPKMKKIFEDKILPIVYQDEGHQDSPLQLAPAPQCVVPVKNNNLYDIPFLFG